jgi:hypothetical protein
VKALPLLPLAAALLLSGCSSQSSTLWGQYLQVLRESYRQTTGGGRVTMDQAAAVPYASVAYRADGGSERMLVLASDTNGDLLWTAASRVVLLTRDGRLLRSIGLPHDRGGLSPQAGSTLAPPVAALKAPYRSVRLADFPDLSLYGVTLNCVTTARGRANVMVLGTALVTTRVDETCQSQRPRWSFTDSYWLDADSGFVWMSMQNVHPSGTRLQIKILRPPE